MTIRRWDDYGGVEFGRWRLSGSEVSAMKILRSIKILMTGHEDGR